MVAPEDLADGTFFETHYYCSGRRNSFLFPSELFSTRCSEQEEGKSTGRSK